MLLGHNDDYTADRAMQVTVAYNHFKQGLVERMPRCRHGYFHIVNHDYTEWKMYAIGGSANPTIEGNTFFAKTRKSWHWRSGKNLFLNGAYFITSGELDRSMAKPRASLPSPRPTLIRAALLLDHDALVVELGAIFHRTTTVPIQAV
ncbi:hypothetical protein SELMODRAFT_421677 [Selaginella moellendorffii]|uniref:Pectate lyase n=1 Tax=Selaginella moellendorffii TaxID=88036 RepID=D8SG09_SELML|nr:hypothetical protein SELMODRAFT_421677 [Selaginella moellendorffii]